MITLLQIDKSGSEIFEKVRTLTRVLRTESLFASSVRTKRQVVLVSKLMRFFYNLKFFVRVNRVRTPFYPTVKNQRFLIALKTEGFLSNRVKHGIRRGAFLYNKTGHNPNINLSNGRRE